MYLLTRQDAKNGRDDEWRPGQPTNLEILSDGPSGNTFFAENSILIVFRNRVLENDFPFDQTSHFTIHREIVNKACTQVDLWRQDLGEYIDSAVICLVLGFQITPRSSDGETNGGFALFGNIPFSLKTICCKTAHLTRTTYTWTCPVSNILRTRTRPWTGDFCLP